MSAYSTPIPLPRFAAAIKVLPLSNLHSLAAELRNSIAHLGSSNLLLAPFAEGDDVDKDCVDAIRENKEVMVRMMERIGILRHEVEGRGFRWAEPEMESGVGGVDVLNGGNDDGEEEEEEEESPAQETNGAVSRGLTAESGRRSTGGRIGDEELRRRLEERLNEEEDGEEENGVLHL